MQRRAGAGRIAEPINATEVALTEADLLRNYLFMARLE